ncbi:MAG: branched-chain amino acid ABC transporter permease [Pseudonocardiales bacterium]|nr:MAG: branched-chain amino acid ABC transporter permease [Pseudonocardiales bacterium]
MTALTSPVAKPPRSARTRQRRLSSQAVWSLSLVTLVIAAFIFYNQILPNLADSVAGPVSRWAPITAINECLIYVIMALGLNVVVGYAGLLDLGYVAFWAIGSYVGAYLMSDFIFQLKDGIHIGSSTTVRTLPGIHLSFWAVLAIGAAVCALFGILIGFPTLRLRGDYLAIVTLGFGEIIPQFFTNGDRIGGLNLTNGTRGITPVDPINTGYLSNILGLPRTVGLSPASLPYKFLFFSVLAAICVFVSLRIRGGRLGRSWLAIREDELAANMMGVPLVKAKLSAYAVGAIFGGLGGVAYAEHVGGALADSFKYSNSIFVLIMVVLGGMGNVWGVITGAFVLAWINNTGLQEFGNTFNGWFGTHVEIPSYNFLIFGTLLVLMMLFRREGLLPERRTQQILREPARTEMESVGSDVEAGQASEGDEEPEQSPEPARAAP